MVRERVGRVSGQPLGHHIAIAVVHSLVSSIVYVLSERADSHLKIAPGMRLALNLVIHWSRQPKEWRDLRLFYSARLIPTASGHHGRDVCRDRCDFGSRDLHAPHCRPNTPADMRFERCSRRAPRRRRWLIAECIVLGTAPVITPSRNTVDVELIVYVVANVIRRLSGLDLDVETTESSSLPRRVRRSSR